MDFKKISELFTVAVPLLIICSCIRLMTYYHNWNIPILDYLSAPELLFLFVQPAITITALAAIYLGANALIIGAGYLYARSRAGKRDSEAEPDVAAKGIADTAPDVAEKGVADTAEVKQEKTSLWGRIGPFLPILALPFLAWIFFQGIWYEYEIFPVVMLHVVIWLVAIGIIRTFTEPDREAPSLRAVLWGTMIMLISASYFVGRYEVNATITNPVQHTIVLKDGSTFATDANLIYLGKSSNYYFLFDNATQRSSIIPNSEVKRIDLAR